MIILIVLSLAILLCGIVSLVSRQHTARLRSRGLLPQAGHIPTMEHVRQLVAAGETIQAIKIYREIHRVGLKEAKEMVDKFSVR